MLSIKSKVSEDLLRKSKGIYILRNLTNGKVYVGKTQRNFYQRMCEHEGSLRHKKYSNIRLQQAYNKYGIENFEWDVLVFMPDELIKICEKRKTNSIDENAIWVNWLNEQEIYWIEFYSSKRLSYNTAPGGEYKRTFHTSDELRKSISIGQKRSYATSPTRRTLITQRNRERAKNAEFNKRNREKIKAFYQTPEGKCIAKERAKKRKPGWSDKLSSILKDANSRPEVKIRRSQGQINAYQSEARHEIQRKAAQKANITRKIKRDYELICVNAILIGICSQYEPSIMFLNLTKKKELILEIASLYGRNK